MHARTRPMTFALCSRVDIEPGGTVNRVRRGRKRVWGLSLKTILNIYKNHRELIEQLGAKVLRKLSEGVEQRGGAQLVVSAGSTPIQLFEYLSEQPMDWQQVTVILSDERCVSEQDHNSNARLVKTWLLQNRASDAHFLSLYEYGQSPDTAATRANEKLSAFTGPYDAVILGLGNDGHTASLFPRAKNLPLALSDDAPDCLPVYPVTNRLMRVTQTARRLLHTRFLALHFVGRDKERIIGQALRDKHREKYPVSHFIHQSRVPLHIYHSL